VLWEKSGHPTLSEKLAQLSGGLGDRSRTRQRVFAAHAHDTQQLQQMVAVLTHRTARPAGQRDRGISSAGLMEEGQLYAVCMQELAAQIAVHSPALSEMAGALFHGFVALFQRSVTHQEGRLTREREAHERTRVLLREAEAETAHWRAQKEEIERKLIASRRLLEDKDRTLSAMEKCVSRTPRPHTPHARSLHPSRRAAARQGGGWLRVLALCADAYPCGARSDVAWPLRFRPSLSLSLATPAVNGRVDLVVSLCVCVQARARGALGRAAHARAARAAPGCHFVGCQGCA
jgi:hypothetical protein